ncbi:MAG: tRNA lysidine(34) synthetase TilS, partial [Clostridia bacterium]|nr:tRNA lysidine(34) synthetase TilS [Clostridia bacterium]
MGFYSGGTRDTLSLSDKSYLHGKRVLVALSGGKDSVCLLRLLCLERDRGALSLFAAHVEHGIRGEASKRDMEFCFELCQSLGVPFYSLGTDVPRLAEESGEGLETCARRVRHEFLRKTARELNCDLIALAHHRRDRAETLLMHLLRGSSLKGMAAMPEIDKKPGGATLVRPLIDVSPEEIKQYLEDIGQPWREDATNFLPDNPRNAIRLSVLPLLRDIYPGSEDALCRF